MLKYRNEIQMEKKTLSWVGNVYLFVPYSPELFGSVQISGQIH